MQVIKTDFCEQFNKTDGDGQLDLAGDEERNDDCVQRASGPPGDCLDETAIVVFDHECLVLLELCWKEFYKFGA